MITANPGIMPTPTRLILCDGKSYEVVTAIRIPPLYGNVTPCWVVVLRAEAEVFLVATVTAGVNTYHIEYPSNDMRARRAHKVAWTRAKDRHDLAGKNWDGQ